MSLPDPTLIVDIMDGFRRSKAMFAAVQGVFEGCAGESGRVDDLGGDSGGKAEALEIERETVTDIDGGGGAKVVAQVAAEFETRLGIEVSFPGFAFAGCESKGGPAESARHVDFVVNASAIAA